MVTPNPRSTPPVRHKENLHVQGFLDVTGGESHDREQGSAKVGFGIEQCEDRGDPYQEC